MASPLPTYIDFPGKSEPLPPSPTQTDKVVMDGPSVPLQDKKDIPVVSASVTALSETALIGDLSPLGTATLQTKTIIRNSAMNGGNNVQANGLKSSAAPVLASNTKSTAAGNFA